MITKIRVCARGTNNHTHRRRAGMVFTKDLQEVVLDLDKTEEIEKYIALAEDGHLLVIDGPALADAKAELERRQKAARAAAGASAQLPATVNFGDRDEVSKALKALADRNEYLQAENAKLQAKNSEQQADLEDLRGELAETTSKFEERMARLEAAQASPATTTTPAAAQTEPAKPTAPAEQPKGQGKGGQK